MPPPGPQASSSQVRPNPGTALPDKKNRSDQSAVAIILAHKQMPESQWCVTQGDLVSGTSEVTMTSVQHLIILTCTGSESGRKFQ